MEENLTLAERMRRNQVFDESETAIIALGVCEALKVYHNAEPPMIYDDIRPETVLLGEDNTVSMMESDRTSPVQREEQRDFVPEPPDEYTAPERYGFGIKTPQTDLFSLGILVNVLLCGFTPSEHRIEGSMGDIIERCCAVEPSERYENVEELEGALNRLKTPNRSKKQKAVKQPKQVKKEKDTTQNSYMIPGFRTKTPWKMIVAVLGYFLILRTGLGLEVENAHPGETGLNRFFFTLTMLEIVLFCSDYRGIRTNIPFFNREKHAGKLLSTLLGSVILLILNVAVLTVLESVIFS